MSTPEPGVRLDRMTFDERIAYCRERNAAEHEAQGVPLIDTDPVRLATVARLLAGAETTERGAA